MLHIKSPTGPWLLLDSTALHCSTGCHPTYYYRCTRCGVRSMWCQNLPGLVPRNPGSPLTQKSSHPSLPGDKSEGRSSTPPWAGCKRSGASLGCPQLNPKKISPHLCAAATLKWNPVGIWTLHWHCFLALGCQPLSGIIPSAGYCTHARIATEAFQYHDPTHQIQLRVMCLCWFP
jgi:hypothetical protein